MPEHDRRTQVAVADAIDATSRAFEAHGAPERTARVQAGHLVEAEMRGHPSHGLRRVAVLVGRMANDLIDPAAQPAVVWHREATAHVDGRLGFGPVTAYAVLDALAEKAATTGVAVAAMSRTHHLGMLAPYVEHAAERGLVCLVLSSTEGLVHPWGGRGALLGTNPLGLGIPSAGGDVVLDMSTGAVSAGKILDYAARGEPLPAGWAVDAEGRETSDARAAAAGAISPFGGAKGYALGLALGALVGSLSGTAFGEEVAGTLAEDRPTTKGDVMIVIDPRGVDAVPRPAPLADYLADVRASGIDGRSVAIPGDRARRARDAAEKEGIDVSLDVWNQIVAFGDDANRSL